jgi:hypothetical protein
VGTLFWNWQNGVEAASGWRARREGGGQCPLLAGGLGKQGKVNRSQDWAGRGGGREHGGNSLHRLGAEAELGQGTVANNLVLSARQA